MTTNKHSPWRKHEAAVDGDGGGATTWRRPLIGSEYLFDTWIDEGMGWVEWMSALEFTATAGALAAASPSDAEQRATRAVRRLLALRPTFLARVERGEAKGGDGGGGVHQRCFSYAPLRDADDLAARTRDVLEVVHAEEPRRAAREALDGFFHAGAKQRLTLELGPSLVRFVVFVPTRPGGEYALVFRTSHAVSDFWVGTSTMELFLHLFCQGETSAAGALDTVGDGSDIARLAPSYVDLLKEPVDHFQSDEAERNASKEFLQKFIAPITVTPVSAENLPAGAPGFDAQVKRSVLSSEATSALIARAKALGFTVTCVLQTLLVVANLAVNGYDRSRTSTQLNCVSNRLPLTTAYDPAKGAAQKRFDVAPILATSFVPSELDLSPYLREPDWRKSFVALAREVRSALERAKPVGITEKDVYVRGPDGIGAFAYALPAMASGAAPRAPGLFTPLSSPGLLDGAHFSHDYVGEAGTLRIDDLHFAPRVSPLLGCQVWAWTLLGRLNLVAAMPDPRECATPKALEVFRTWVDMVQAVAAGDFAAPA